MAKPDVKVSSKHRDIVSANNAVTASVGIAAFMIIFAITGVINLNSQRGFQSRVIDKREKAVIQLQNNLEAAEELNSKYQDFVDEDPNIIEGSLNGTEDEDGDNAKIVLDALPSSYDFPALITSLEKILSEDNYPVSLTGDDDEIAQSQVDNGGEPIEVPFGVETSGNAEQLVKLFEKFEKIIRPMKINSLEISASNDILKLEFEANTFYAPESKLKIDSEVVR